MFVDYRSNVPHSRTILNLFDKFKTDLTFILACVRDFVKFHSNKSREYSACFDWFQLKIHARQSFTRQILAYQHD